MLLLDAAWGGDAVSRALLTAGELLAQCELGFRVTGIYTFEGSEYLRDLDAGASRTLLESFWRQQSGAINLVFARDSHMQNVYDGQAFGRANSRARPWLTGSAWFLQGVRDLPQVIAHELFHVLANDGSHAPGADNLMSAQTGPEKTQLTAAQCALARSY